MKSGWMDCVVLQIKLPRLERSFLVCLIYYQLRTTNKYKIAPHEKTRP